MSMVLVATPFAAAAIAWRGGWLPASDQATVVIRAYDTFSSRPPLVGIYSSATTSTSGEQALHHPGPLQEWLLAVPIHLFAPSAAGALFGSAALVALCIATVLFVARRRGGPAMLGTAVVFTAGFMAAAGATTLRQPLHSDLATYAMLALLGCAWAVLDDDPWFWPGVVFFGSLAAQAQVAFAPPVVGVWIVVVAGRFLAWQRARRPEAGEAPGTREAALPVGRESWRVVAVTVGVVLVCWSGPLVDQVARSGNLWALLTAGGQNEPIGPGFALHELAGTLALPPAWLFHDLRFALALSDAGNVIWHTGLDRLFTAVVAAGGAGWSLWWTVRTGHRRQAALGVVAVAALLGSFVASVVMPDSPFSVAGHREIWRAPGMVLWWFLVLAAVAVVPQSRSGDRPLPRWIGATGAAATVVVAVAVSATLLAASSPARDTGSMSFAQLATFTRAAAPYCDSHGTVAVSGRVLGDSPVVLGLMSTLQLHGCEVHGDGYDTVLPGPAHAVTGHEPVHLLVTGDAAPGGYERLATFDPDRPPAGYEDFTHVLRGLQSDGTLYLYVQKR